MHMLNALTQQRGGGSPKANNVGGRRYDSRRDRGANRGTVGSVSSSVPGLSEAAAKARRENNQCYWCGSKEHTKRDCPDRAAGKPPRLN